MPGWGTVRATSLVPYPECFALHIPAMCECFAPACAYLALVCAFASLLVLRDAVYQRALVVLARAPCARVPCTCLHVQSPALSFGWHAQMRWASDPQSVLIDQDTVCTSISYTSEKGLAQHSCTAYAEWWLQPGNANVVPASMRDRGLVASNILHSCVLCGGSLCLDLSCAGLWHECVFYIWT